MRGMGIEPVSIGIFILEIWKPMILPLN